MAESNGNSFADDFPDLGYFPPFAGGGTPAFVGDDTPDIGSGTPSANNNKTDGNGNWYFSSDNTTTGNGNWYFGNDNTTNGNGNWYIGDENAATGNGNRPIGSGNDITGNGNRPSGDGNTITGNRQETSEDNQNILGNSDRYFTIGSNGDITLVSDGTSNGFGDWSAVENSSETTDNNGGGTMEEEALNDLFRSSPFGRLLDIPGVESPEDIFGNLGGGNPFGDGENPMGGDGGVLGGNPWAGWNPVEDGNPFDPNDDITGNDGSGPIAGSDGIPLPGEEITFEIEDGGYFLRDGQGNWYFSSDNLIGDGDTSLGAGTDSIINGDTFFGEENPFGFVTDGSLIS